MVYTFAILVLLACDIFINLKLIWRSVCVYVQVQEESEDGAKPKYVIQSPPSFCSKFLLEMEMKKICKIEEEQRKQEEQERLATEVSVLHRIH